MARQTILANPLTPVIGAELSGVDLARPLDDGTRQEILDALTAHGVVFFRDQALDMGKLVALGRSFGALHLHTGMSRYSEEFPEITRIHADENSEQINGEEWHTDLSCDLVPPMGSILYIHTLPPSGGDTIFVSMYAAYDALSQKMKDYLEGLTATHDGALAFSKYGRDRKFPVASHPVVCRHPVTGRKLLYVNKGFTSHINELDRDESAAILRYLYQHIVRPQFQCRFRWRKNSVAFWDNRCTQHTAIWDYYPGLRSGYRIQIKQESAMTA